MEPPQDDDEASWLVYEDWLLESDDPRARLVRLEKAGEDTSAVRAELAEFLFGSEQFAQAVEGRAWRAGFARVAIVAPSPMMSVDVWGRAPALALVRELKVVAQANVGPVVNAVAKAPFSSRLESFALSYAGVQPGSLDASLLPRAPRLRVRGALSLVYAPQLASLRALDLGLLPAAVATLLGPGRFAELRSLTVRTGTLLYSWHGVFDHVFAGTCAPRLEELHLEAAPASSVDFLRELASSPLAARLEMLTFAGVPCSIDALRRLGRSEVAQRLAQTKILFPSLPLP